MVAWIYGQYVITKGADLLKPKLSVAGQRAMEQASEKGVSAWLTAIPMSKHAFRDALCLRFGWRLATHIAHVANHLVLAMHSAVQKVPCLPSDVTPSETLLHNSSQRYACPNVCIEPPLQPLTGESFPLRSTNTEECARLEFKAQNFWDKSNQLFLMSESSILMHQ